MVWKISKLSKLWVQFLSILFLFLMSHLSADAGQAEVTIDESGGSVESEDRLTMCYYSNDASSRGTNQAIYDYAQYTDYFLDMNVRVIFPRIILTSNPLTDAYKAPTHFVRSESRFSGLYHGSRNVLDKFLNKFGSKVSFCGEGYSDDLYAKALNYYKHHEGGKTYDFCPDLAYHAAEVAGCDVLYIIKGGRKAHNPLYPTSFFYKIGQNMTANLMMGSDLRGIKHRSHRKRKHTLLNQKPGTINSVVTLVHGVFDWDPHGNVYAAISDSVKGYSPKAAGNIVPHIVTKPLIILTPEIARKNLENKFGWKNYRWAMKIPDKALVLCRHGGNTTFDIEYVHKTMLLTLGKYDDSQLHYVFMGTDRLYTDLNYLIERKYDEIYNDPILMKQMGKEYENDKNNGKITRETSLATYLLKSPIKTKVELRELIKSRVHFIPSTSDDYEKEKYFETCNAMIHGRSDGETFGLAVGEMSLRQKPVITQEWAPRYFNQHVKILGEKGYYYNNQKELMDIIDEFVVKGINKKKDHNAYRKFHPKYVMQTFKRVFLESALPLVGKPDVFQQQTIW